MVIYAPSIMVTINSRMIIILCTHSPISFKHMMPFWYPLLEPRLTTYHSNIGVWLREVTELGTSTSLKIGEWSLPLSWRPSLRHCWRGGCKRAHKYCRHPTLTGLHCKERGSHYCTGHWCWARRWGIHVQNRSCPWDFCRSRPRWVNVIGRTRPSLYCHSKHLSTRFPPATYIIHNRLEVSMVR